MSETNIFRCYEQEENRFTNGLFSIFDLSRIEDKSFVSNFLKKNLPKIKIPRDRLYFKVLQGYEGTADAEISNNKLCFHIETKIKSGTLQKDQIKLHLKHIKKIGKKTKGLILLTPDNSESRYIKQYKSIEPIIHHLNWRRVYDYLKNYIENKHQSLFKEIISQYLTLVHDIIFEQDIVAVIAKMNFSDESGVKPNEYLKEMRRGEWSDWGTPTEYKNLDGTGRKLILYDPSRRALTVEAEIRRVVKERGKYPWRNKFINKHPKIYDRPIPVKILEKIKKFENFSKCRASHMNLTHDEYNELMKLKSHYEKN